MKNNHPDSTDKAILMLLFSAKRSLSGTHIARAISVSAPCARTHMLALESAGIIRKFAIGKERIIKRRIGKKTITMCSPSRILWELDLAPKQDNSIISEVFEQ